MRSATGTIRPDEGLFRPLDAVLLEESGGRREAVDQLDRLADGTPVVVFEVSGDPDRVMELFEGHSEAIGHQAARGDGTVLFHSHLEPTPLVERPLDLRKEYEFAIDMPMLFTVDGRLRVTPIAEESTIPEVFGSSPGSIRFDIERAGVRGRQHADALAAGRAPARDVAGGHRL